MENQYFDKKVYLIGAGPGDAGLMTVKGRELLAAADTVIYDALAGDGIMGFIPGTAKQIYVGKEAAFIPLPRRRLTGFWWRGKEGRTGSQTEGRRSLCLWTGRRGGAGA